MSVQTQPLCYHAEGCLQHGYHMPTVKLIREQSVLTIITAILYL